MTETRTTYHTGEAYSRQEIEDFIAIPLGWYWLEITLPTGKLWSESVPQWSGCRKCEPDAPANVLERLSEVDPQTGEFLVPDAERFSPEYFGRDPLMAASEALRLIICEKDWSIPLRPDAFRTARDLVAANPRIARHVTVEGNTIRCAKTGGAIIEAA